MQLNDPRDTFYKDRMTALTEHRRLVRLGAKAYLRKYVHPRRGNLYRVRIQKQIPA